MLQTALVLVARVLSEDTNRLGRQSAWTLRKLREAALRMLLPVRVREHEATHLRLLVSLRLLNSRVWANVRSIATSVSLLLASLLMRGRRRRDGRLWRMRGRHLNRHGTAGQAVAPLLAEVRPLRHRLLQRRPVGLLVLRGSLTRLVLEAVAALLLEALGALRVRFRCRHLRCQCKAHQR
jgi:hypothetical protein